MLLPRDDAEPPPAAGNFGLPQLDRRKQVWPVERRVRLLALSGIGQRIGRRVDSRFGESTGHHAASVHRRGLVFRHAHFRERIGAQRQQNDDHQHDQQNASSALDPLKFSRAEANLLDHGTTPVGNVASWPTGTGCAIDEMAIT